MYTVCICVYYLMVTIVIFFQCKLNPQATRISLLLFGEHYYTVTVDTFTARSNSLLLLGHSEIEGQVLPVPLTEQW